MDQDSDLGIPVTYPSAWPISQLTIPEATYADVESAGKPSSSTGPIHGGGTGWRVYFDGDYNFEELLEHVEKQVLPVGFKEISRIDEQPSALRQSELKAVTYRNADETLTLIVSSNTYFITPHPAESHHYSYEIWTPH